VDPQSFLTRIRAAAASLTAVQIVTLVVTFVGVSALVAGSAYWVNTPTYSVLFSDLDPESAGAVSSKLKNEKVAFRLDEGGRTVRVPAAQVDQLRLDFASQGLPGAGRIGFEIFDRTAFGVTDFLEHVNYRRALEGELARTISTLAEVSSARVHIALPKTSLFAGQDQPAKASVVLKLRSSRPLAASTSTAISGLVAGAVEGLRPEGVVIIDNFGHPLTRTPDEPENGSAAHFERQRQIERDLSARVASLLEPIVGSDHVRVNVSATLKTDSQEETEDRWDPTPIVRSRQSVSQGGAQASASTGTQAAAVQGGVAGARGNLPSADTAAKPAPAQAAVAPAATTPANTSETTNYEVSRLTRHRVQPSGEVSRLSVAVLLDEARPDKAAKSGAAPAPRSAADVQKIHDVVAAAVGLDTERGDQLTVETVAFETSPVEEAPPESRWRQYVPLVMDGGRIVAISLIGVLVVFGVVRPTLKRAIPAPDGRTAADPRALPRTIADVDGEIDAGFDAALESGPGQARRLPVLTRRVAKLAQQEPEHAARLVRSWLAEEDR
jgi:flagellar M-ring protein FliF